MKYIIEHNTKTGLDGRLKLFCPKIINKTKKPVPFSGIGYSCGKFAAEGAQCLAFKSEWGQEFTPQWSTITKLTQPLVIASRNGRSSHGHNPFLYIIMPNNCVMAIAVCYSGSWALKITPQGEVLFLQEQEYFTGVLSAGESLRVPSVLVAYGENGLFKLCAEAREWYESNMLSPSRVPCGCFEWNHWWTYEDVGITEEIFIKNVDAAAQLGVNVCTLDAGWFGSAENESHWALCRGDWALVNKKRFPRGIKYLSDYVHNKGMLFGIWIEAEALGEASQLMAEHSGWAAENSACPQPYMCLAAEGAAEWLYNTFCTLVDTTQCDWIKLDFNVDPQDGCKSELHKHSQGMGLYRHYEALYCILRRVREKYPKLIIENCSSGGLRLDLEILRYTDVSFLSDPDESDHSLQCFWAASLLISPHRLLHWAHSETRLYADGSRVFPSFDITKNTPAFQIKTVLRTAMLHCAGVSRELFSMPQNAKEIFREEIKFYKACIAPLLQSGTLQANSPQPLRTNARINDERDIESAPSNFTQQPYAAFSLWGKSIYVFVFSLENGEKSPVKISGFNVNVKYEINCRDTEYNCVISADNGDLSFKLPFNKGESRVYCVTYS